MGFKVAVVVYSQHGSVHTLANVIAEGAKKASPCSRRESSTASC